MCDDNVHIFLNIFELGKQSRKTPMTFLWGRGKSNDNLGVHFNPQPPDASSKGDVHTIYKSMELGKSIRGGANVVIKCKNCITRGITNYSTSPTEITRAFRSTIRIELEPIIQ